MLHHSLTAENICNMQVDNNLEGGGKYRMYRSPTAEKGKIRLFVIVQRAEIGADTRQASTVEGTY